MNNKITDYMADVGVVVKHLPVKSWEVWWEDVVAFETAAASTIFLCGSKKNSIHAKTKKYIYNIYDKNSI